MFISLLFFMMSHLRGIFYASQAADF